MKKKHKNILTRVLGRSKNNIERRSILGRRCIMDIFMKKTVDKLSFVLYTNNIIKRERK
tara:strand:- start:199 stop:375 length:177 start_codon:yes stop_codon:yes gene_type:complete